MLAFFANLFGYVLNFLYELCKNYGLAMILFSILVKVLMIPLSIKQQKSMKKSAKIQNELKQIQFKYKNDPEKMNQETMALYKRENMSPFSGCLSSILQIILLFSIFYLVRSPLTYMKKIDTVAINEMKQIIQQEENIKTNYPEITIIRYAKSNENQKSVNIEEELIEQNEDRKEKDNTENNEESKETQNKDIFEEYKDKLNINMDLFGIDLSKVPKDNFNDYKALIIPALYVISSFISIRYNTTAQKRKKKEKIEEIDENNGEKREDVNDAMEDTSKMMSWFMPLMSISIACVAPLGLALYWLMNNILMIIEKFVFDKVLKNDDNKEGAVKNG